MKVSTRIGGSFSLLCLLTLLLGYISWSNLVRISQQVETGSREIAPMVSDSGQLAAQLDLIHNLSLQYLISNETQRDGLSEQIDQQQAGFRQRLLQMQQRYAPIDRFAGPLAAIGPAAEGFFAAATAVQPLHRQNLQLQQAVSNRAVDFSYLRGELESELQRIREDSSDGKAGYAAGQFASEIQFTMTLIESLPNQVRPAEITRNLEEIDQQNGKHLRQMKLLGASEDEAVIDGLPVLEDFMAIMNSDQGLVARFRQMLANRATINRLMSEMSSTSAVARTRLNELTVAARELSEQSADSAEQTLDSSTRLIIAAVVIVVLISLFTGLRVTRGIARSLAQLSSTLVAVAGGDLTRRAAVHGKDEFARLATEVNGLISHLSELLEQIRQGADQLARTAEQTHSISVRTTRDIDRQQLQTSRAASAITEMSCSAREVAGSADQTLQRVSAVDSRARQGGRQMDDSIASTRRLAGSIDASAKVVARLQQQSSDIGTVLNVIREIAEQTNLLALNAAIEAARAGEMGRGFAVVADEVRSLASRTQGSTEEIQQIIEDLRAGAGSAVEHMELSRSEAGTCIEQSSALQRSLSEIRESISEIRSMNTQIASAVDQQQGAVEEVSTVTAQLDEIATHTQQGASETERYSRELSRIADQQQQLISRFRL